MFFDKAKDARLYAQMEHVRTGIVHRVVQCKKFLCPPKQYFGKDYIQGFTVIIS